MHFAWAVLSSAACLALQSSQISNGTIFGNKVIEYEGCVFFGFLCSFFLEKSHSQKNSTSIVNLRRSSCKVPVIRIRF